ncbi:endonuclease [Mariniphaga sediminis]|uniref:endonuclease n=1 Tax=Mariniphaga sediminis TaxID=1628158 RepID=UPI0015587640|nr:endonuclease [Mariniphaga sediminis]
MFNNLKIIFLLLLISSYSYSQIPDGYYTTVDNLIGEQLKSELHNIIKDHVEFPYTSSSTDTWDILKETDRDTTNPENVILFYTGWSVNAAQEYNDNTGWSREHVWAKSHGDFGTTMGAGTDVHHLRPADITVNSARNNKDFDYGGSLYVDGDGATECYTDADSWEPRDAVKGDVARMLFYMAVRYEGDGDEPDLELVDTVNTFDLNESGKGYMGKLSTLLEWNKEDPVDSFEIHRNDVIYSYQKNRNPFIDHPEFVDLIWGDNVTVVDVFDIKEITLYPNPASEYVVIEAPFEGDVSGEIYNTSGVSVLRFDLVGSSKRINLNGWCNGIYFLKITNGDVIYRKKMVVSNFM